MNKVFDEYFYKIYNWSLKKTHNKEDAEDLTNDVFTSIFEYLSKDIEIKKLENLIWKVAYNLWSTRAKKYIKEKNNTPIDDNLNIGYDSKIIEKVIYNEILKDLDTNILTDKETKTFKMYYLYDLSIKEISNKLNTTDSNIKYYLYSARNKIKEKYHE